MEPQNAEEKIPAGSVGNPTNTEGRERLLELADEEGLPGRDGMNRAELSEELTETMTPENLSKGLSDTRTPEELVEAVRTEGTQA
jgi:hypothetical protein